MHVGLLKNTVSAASATDCEWRINPESVLQFLGISFVVGKEAIGHIQRREAPEEEGFLLAIAVASVVVLSVLCGLKLDLSVRSLPVKGTLQKSLKPQVDCHRFGRNSSTWMFEKAFMSILYASIILRQACMHVRTFYSFSAEEAAVGEPAQGRNHIRSGGSSVGRHLHVLADVQRGQDALVV